MSTHKFIAQVFENNMGNRLTPQLASGMIRSLVDILVAGASQPKESVQVVESQSTQEVDHGVV